MSKNVLSRKELEKQLLLLREESIRAARISFWDYCVLDAPDFYKLDRWHLVVYCKTLQALYERNLTKGLFYEICDGTAPDWFIEQFDWERMDDDYVFSKLMINMPPRMGKSRTLVNFCKWVLGQDITKKIMTCSYNDDMAQEFSRYTRDGIDAEKMFPHEVVFSDIFPGTKVKKGDASYKKWALEGNFFNYIGAGIGGSITGKGGDIAIVDDPIKDAEQAYNENALNKIWLWYTGTFKSRLEEKDGVAGIEIVNHTRWSDLDICGRLLANEQEGKEWFVLHMEAYYEEYDALLCPALLSKRRYNSLKRNVDPHIFFANYHQKTLNAEGRLYKKIKTYTELPKDEKGQSVTEGKINYTDTADMGDDYLCSICAEAYNGELYITDILYSKEGMEETEPATAKMLIENGTGYALFESNNGGRGFARNVEKDIYNTYKSRKCAVKWFHQSKNKKARILTHATYIMNSVYFPVNWHDRWPEFYAAIMGYQREGKNAHDDAPDALTGLAEMMEKQPKMRSL
jgi:predicted phage terminase large subunit-like protein